jgi:hypothetical protein
LYLAGRQWWPTDTEERILNQHRGRFTAGGRGVEHLEEAIAEQFYLGEERMVLDELMDADVVRLKTSEIASLATAGAGGFLGSNLTQQQCNTLNEFLRNQVTDLYGRVAREHGGGKRWRMIPKTSTSGGAASEKAPLTLS